MDFTNLRIYCQFNVRIKREKREKVAKKQKQNKTTTHQEKQDGFLSATSAF